MNPTSIVSQPRPLSTVADPTECQHLNLAHRRQRHGAIVKQCQDCGRNCSNAIAQNKLHPAERASIEDFDYDLEEKGRIRGEEERKLRRTYGDGFRILKDGFKLADEYREYLRSPEWKAKRQAVIERQGNLCEGCRAAPVDEVHHKTYNNIGNELLFQLVGLCWSCHRRAHPEKQ